MRPREAERWHRPARALAAQRGRCGDGAAPRARCPGGQGPVGRPRPTTASIPPPASCGSSMRCAATAHGVAVATHDAGLLAESLRRLIASGTPCSAELFLGLPFRRPGARGAPSGGTDPRLRPVWSRWGARTVSRTSRSIRPPRGGCSRTWCWGGTRRGGASDGRAPICERRRADAGSIPWVNSVFEQPWWLDAVAPGPWSAAEVRRGDEVVARLPYMRRRAVWASRPSSSRR